MLIIFCFQGCGTSNAGAIGAEWVEKKYFLIHFLIRKFLWWRVKKSNFQKGKEYLTFTKYVV
jgi:hypothetical protein